MEQEVLLALEPSVEGLEGFPSKGSGILHTE